MPRLEEEPIARTHLWLFKRDIERLQQLFGDKIGYSRSVRMIVRKFLDGVEAKATENTKAMQISTLELDTLPEDDHGDNHND